jgi:two-component system response regulator GlrR
MAVQRKAQILVVDDDPQVLRLFGKILTKGGYSVTESIGSSQAVRILGEKPIDLLVLDLDMPEPDGIDILKSVRRQRPGLRVLVVSGYMQGALLKASELLGATASLAKTDAPTSLLKTVDAILK